MACDWLYLHTPGKQEGLEKEPEMSGRSEEIKNQRGDITFVWCSGLWDPFSMYSKRVITLHVMSFSWRFYPKQLTVD